MSDYKNFVKMTVTSAVGGTGTITLNAASSGFRSFATVYGADATVDVLITEGSAWEVARNCTYTHSGTTLTRGTLENSSTGSALSLTSAATVEVVLPASSINRYESAGLNTLAASVTTADVTGVVGTLHYLDLSGLTAARNFTLPAVAAVDDRVGVYVSVGCTTAGRELILKAATGDTLNGVSAAEWSRVFITGECVIMRCVVANTAWVVDYDGRIPCQVSMLAVSAQTGVATSTWTTITKGATGSWATPINIGSMADIGSNAIITRRAGNYIFYIDSNFENLNDQVTVLFGVRKNGAGNEIRSARVETSKAGSYPQVTSFLFLVCAAADSWTARFLHTHPVSRDVYFLSGEQQSTFSAVEQL